jgi:hypothetical protein
LPAFFVNNPNSTFQENSMSTIHSRDRRSLCAFTFADGRQCRSPRFSADSQFCFFHARKEARARAADALGRDISALLSGNYLSACELTAALGRLFTAVAQGHLKPRTAATLAYLGQTILQSIRIAEQEYINAFGTDFWRQTIRTSFRAKSSAASPNQDQKKIAPSAQPPAQAPAPAPVPVAAATPRPMPNSASELANMVLSQSPPLRNPVSANSLESTLAKVRENKRL